MEQRTIVFMPAKRDVIFKLFFGDERNLDFLIGFLQSVLKLPADEYADVQIRDPHLKRDYPDDKLAVLDVKVKTKSGKLIDIEIQLHVTPQMRERVVLYTSKMVAQQIESGDDYEVIKQVITIVITGETLIGEHGEYHDSFTYYSPKTGTQFTDLTEIHILELSKLPKESDGTNLYDWLEFINADSEEELTMIAEKKAHMEAPVSKLIELNQSEEARMLFEAREKQLRDNKAMMRRAMTEGLNKGLREGRFEGMKEGIKEGMKEGERAKALEIARSMVAKNIPLGDVMGFTGLSREEIEGLGKVSVAK